MTAHIIHAFLGFTSTRLGSEVSCPRTLPCKNPEDPVRLKPRTPGLRVKHFTTEPRRTLAKLKGFILVCNGVENTGYGQTRQTPPPPPPPPPRQKPPWTKPPGQNSHTLTWIVDKTPMVFKNMLIMYEDDKLMILIYYIMNILLLFLYNWIKSFYCKLYIIKHKNL